MSVIFLLIPLSLLIAGGFLAAFVWAVRSGQYEDTCTPSMRVLMEDAGSREEASTGSARGGRRNASTVPSSAPATGGKLKPEPANRRAGESPGPGVKSPL